MRCATGALVVLLLTAGAGWGAEFVPFHRELAVPFKFDTKEGYFQAQGVDAACPANALRTKVHFIRLGQPTTKWRPGATIGLNSGDKKLFFHLWTKNYQPPYQADIVLFEDDKKTSEIAFTATFGADAPVPVLVTWTPKGDVSVTAGEETHIVHLLGPVDSVQLAGSTGAGEFDPVEVGRVGSEGGSEACVAP